MLTGVLKEAFGKNALKRSGVCFTVFMTMYMQISINYVEIFKKVNNPYIELNFIFDFMIN